MENQLPTDEHLNNLIRFRQGLYDSGFTRRRDAQFELLDALLLSGPVRSFPEFSLSPVFHRKWSSAYAAIEDGRQDTEWLRQYLCERVPNRGVVLFSLDGTAWPRPQAATLPDRQYVYSPTAAVHGGSIVIGYPYSALAWVAQPNTSWALPVDIQRVPSSIDAIALGVAQVKKLCETRSEYIEQCLHVIVADRKYGNHHFLRPLREQPCGVLVRLRRDRVLYGEPPPYGGRGRPKVHGERFAFKEADTWTEPEQHLRFDDPNWGEVEIQYWDELHAKQAADTPFGVVRVQVHLEREHSPEPMWLAWQGPVWPADVLWRYYQWRWPIESATQWRKQQLYWTLPRFQTEQACERWTMLVSLAQWSMYLARPLVADQPLPWQKPQAELTPGRVQRALGALFTQIGTSAGVSKTRGKSPGWPKGRTRHRPERYPVVKKGRKKAKSHRKAA